jgi:putative component of membrane protein insertase Oxa1/YidC/SpoIIIJ protein YidD
MYLVPQLTAVGQAVFALLATLPSLAAYVFVLILMRIVRRAPGHDPPRIEVTAIEIEPRLSRCCGSGVVEFFVFLYHQSLLRKYFDRNGGRCRFIPSCTEYAIRAVRKFGLWEGLLLTGDRFRRCTPLYQGDYIDFP